MQTTQLFRVKSFGLAVYLAAAGFECRGAVNDNGKATYFFEPAAATMLPAYQAVKATLDGAARAAGAR